MIARRLAVLAVWVGLVAASIAPRAAYGQTAPSLPEVRDATRRALPLLLAAERDRDAANAEFLAAEGGFDPVLRARATVLPMGYYRYATADVTIEQPTPLWGLSLFAGYRLGVGLVSGSPGLPDYSGGSQTNALGELRAGVSVPVVRNGPIDRRRVNVTVRSQGRVIAEAEFARTQIEAVRAATHRYWDWAAAGRRHSIAVDLLRVARERNRGLDVRAGSGDLARYEVQDNERAVLGREAAARAALLSVQRAAIELSLYFRDAEARPIVVEERVPAPEIPLPDAAFTASSGRPERADEAVAARPELRRFDAQRAQLRAELDLARNQALPAVDLVAQVSQDLGSSAGATDTRGRTELAVGVAIEVPILWRAQIGRVRAAEAALARLEALRAFAQDRVVADVRDAVSQMRAALERYEVLTRELALARRVEESERERFRQGDSTIFLVNQREQATAETDARLVDALADWHRARASFEAAMGQR